MTDSEHLKGQLPILDTNQSGLEFFNSEPGRSPMLGKVWNRLQPLRNWWRVTQLNHIGVDLDDSCLIAKGVSARLGVTNGRQGAIQLGAKVELGQGTVLDAWGGTIAINDHVFIGPYSVIYGHGGVTIGKDTLIAAHCQILSSNHTIPNRTRHIRWEPDIPLPTTIGEDVWLGAGVTVLGGVTIGNGCVVGAGAVVTKDLPPYSIAVGVPARVLRTRS